MKSLPFKIEHDDWNSELWLPAGYPLEALA